MRPYSEVCGCSGDGFLESITLRDRRSGQTESVPAAALFILIGAQPRTSWLPPEVSRDDWGYLLSGPGLPAGSWSFERAPLALETSLPGIFAVGDVRDGSTKRVASAVGEGSVVIQQVDSYLEALTGRERAASS